METVNDQSKRAIAGRIFFCAWHRDDRGVDIHTNMGLGSRDEVQAA